MAAAVLVPVAFVTAVALLLPPRGRIADPEYYARGSDIPHALDALQSLRRSRSALDQELNGQLVGLARIVVQPGDRPALAGRPRLVQASDLHNNVLALPALERAARGLPLVFAGDLSDQGTPLETALVRRVAHAGRPVVVVGGNHDSDTSLRRLARDGAIVLTQKGRLRPDGSHGDVVVRVGGLRLAGFTDPSLRLAGQDYEDRFRTGLTIAAQEEFRRWLAPLLGKVDAVVVHDPAIVSPVLTGLRADPPRRPITFLTGHTHKPLVDAAPGALVVGGGSIGAGGTGNLADGPQGGDLGLAILTYRTKPTPLPMAVDQVEIDPDDGSARARRTRVDDKVRRSTPGTG
ncbi:MAG: metallophosphoesterase [Solirubrobacterales bacterium]|nr:metallophosphoesterase [Solirubrobacterales bacterium]